MDTNEFYTCKEDLLERLSNALSEAHDAMILLKANERNADDTDFDTLDTLDSLLDGIRCAIDWSDGEWEAVHPMAEAARRTSKE